MTVLDTGQFKSGKGGARVGSGKKPIVRRNWEPDPGVSALPPEDVPAEQRAFWERNAGLAIEKRTLTVHTVEAWRLLCQLDAEKTATKAAIDTDGRTFLKVTVDGAGVEHLELKAHPLTGAYGRLAKAVETMLARFGLAPFGKAEQPTAKKQAVNEWAQMGQK